MKKINLIEWLSRNSHEKQSPQRFVRYAAMLIMLLTLGVGQMWGAAKQRYIYVGLSNDYHTYKNASTWGINFLNGTSPGVKQASYIGETYNDGSRDYYVYRFYVYDDHTQAEFKGNDSWWKSKSSVTLNGTTNNAIFFSASADGWEGCFQGNFQLSSTGSLSASSTSVAIGTNVTLTPSLSSNSDYNDIKSTTYNITTNPNSGGSMSGNVFSATKAGTYVVTATITYNAKDFTGITKTATATITITVYATITFDKEGGAGGSDSQNAVKGNTTSNVSVPSKTGYNFGGYWTDDNGTGTMVINASGVWQKSISNYTDNSSTPKWTATADHTLYAKWTPDWALYNSSTKLADFTKVNDYEYTLSYDMNVTTHTNLQFKHNGTGYIAGADDPTSTFRALTGNNAYFNWGVVNGVTTGSYIITIKSTDSGSSWSYKAEQKYTLTYDANGATSGSAPTDANSPYAPNTAVTTASSSMTKTSFTLTGWNTKADGSGTHYNLNTPNAFNINSNMTLYAEWTPSVPASARVAGDFGTATMTRTIDGSVTTFTYTFYDKASGIYDFYLDNGSGSAVLKATTGITMSQTGCTSIANSGDGNNKFRVVAGSAGDFTITATYNTSTKTIHMDVTRVDIDAVTPSWWLVGDAALFTNWNTDNHNHPLNRSYRGISNVTYRVVDFKEYDDKYFKPLKGNTLYGQSSGSNQTVTTGTQYAITPTNAENSAFKTNGRGIVWCIVDNTNKKFWVQSPTTYYTITLANGTSGNTNNGVAGTEGTITLTENLYGKLQTKQFASGDRVNISVTAQTGYVIDDITIGATSVATDVNSSSYSGYTTMPSGNATLTVTYKHNYVVTFGVGTSYTSMGSVNNNISHTSGNRIIEGTAITFTATPALGYKFVGWYREAACSNQVSTSNPYATTITGTTTLYAKFDYRPLYIHADWLSWGTAAMTQSTVNRAVYTYEIDPLAAKSGTPASKGHHFHFVNTADNPNDNKAYNYYGVQTPTGSGFLSNSDIHLTDAGNPTIQFDLMHKSKITITLTLQSVDDATKPTVNVAADRYYDIEYTTPSHGSYTIQVGSAGAVSADTEARAGTTITLANSPATGYHFDSWTVEKSEGTVSVSNNQFSMPAEDVTVSASFEATSYDVELNANGGTGAGVTVSATYDAEMPDSDTSSDALVAPTKTGYDFTGYWDATSSGSQYYEDDLSSAKNWDKATNSTLYAQWSAKSYTVTLDVDEANKGTIAGADESASVTYDAAPSTIVNRPTAANGYALDGYYTDHNGEGVKVINGDGTWIAFVAGYTDGSKHWVHDGDVTLYAYYKKAEITDVELNETMFDPVAAGDEGYVVANPTIAPNPTGDHIICWELLYDNDNPVTGHDAIEDPDGSQPNRIKFSIAGLAAGGYKIRTTLRTGSSCAGGTLLDTRVTTFQIANAFTVTVEYKDSEGNTIAASTTSPGKALESTDITAPDLIGYTFSTWQLGEGMSTEEALTTKTDFSYTTTFNSTLTAVYAKKRMIYFNNTLGWESVYVYFYKNDTYWQTVSPYNGSGANTTYTWTNTPYSEGLHGQMQPISEGSNIYYFDAEAAGVNASYDDVVFTEAEQHGEGYFHDTKAVRRGDYKTSLPMFVPADEQTADVHNKTNYYNKGYWMNYPENTGYVLHIYDSKTYGASDGLMSIPFEFTEDKTMPMSLTIELAGGKEYGFEIHRADGNKYGTNTKVMKNGDSGDGGAGWALTENQRTGLLTSVAGDYTFTLSYGEKSGDYHFLAGVHYPVAANDYRVVYNDRVAWSLGSAHDENWYHPSRAINKKDGAEDIVSFYVSKEEGASASMKFQYASSVSGEGVVTWSDVDGGSISLSDITESGVYNFYLTQADGGISVSKIEPYTGQYYIRSQAVTGGWDNYRVGSDHKMTYSEFSESAANTFGEKFSHYKAKWCPRNTNIAFTIANDYSMCITDTLKQDVGNPYSNTDADGKLNNDGNDGHSGSNAYLDPNSANVRFMWNRKTNKISRAYVASSTSTEARFLVLQGSGTANANIFGENGSALSANPPGENATLLRDDQNWIYEITVQANPSALVKLYANYKGQTQYFRGTSDDGFEKGTSAVELLGGTSSSSKYSVRVVYDFKTNRLVTAWQPTGATQEINGELNINADVMVVRSHHESAQCITFANDESALNGVKTVYGVMQFNRWILNNREHPEDDTPEHCEDLSAIATYHRPLAIGDQKSIYERSHYYISFPFDVRLSDVFGFGQYWNEWYIEWYDGLTRAQNGYWIDSPSNWKYVEPEEKDNFVLKANQGYILGLDMDYMQATDFTFWSNKNTTIELYFPSTVSLETLKSTQVTIPALNTIEGDPYRCTINRENGDDGDRRIKDSYWRCIGVPSFNMYNSALNDGEGNTIEWKDDYEWKEDDAAFPFIYLWNKADNTITPQATSEFSFQPMHAYLVQNGGAIVWSAVSAKPSSIVARQRNTEQEDYNWRLELQQNEQMIDRTYIRMKDLESVTDGFDFGQDMSKEFNKKRSAIYSFIGTEKVAANSMTVHTEQTTIVPLGLDIKAAGEYVITMPEGTNGVGVFLIDNIAGTRTNLAFEDYEIYLEKGTIADRFELEININNTPTAIDGVEGGSLKDGKAHKFIMNDMLYILKDGVLYDARGARVK